MLVNEPRKGRTSHAASRLIPSAAIPTRQNRDERIVTAVRAEAEGAEISCRSFRDWESQKPRPGARERDKDGATRRYYVTNASALVFRVASCPLPASRLFSPDIFLIYRE
jgi:hypothetical protein